MPRLRTACTYDCPDACSLIVDPLHGRIEGDPEHPITRGFVCRRIRKHLARLASPERLTAPRLRDGDGWTELDWDAALDLAAEHLGAALGDHGPPSVVFLRGGGSLGLSKTLLDHWFNTLGPVTTLQGGLCGETGEAAQRADFGDCVGHDYTDLDNSGALVLWGKNPIVTGVHFAPFVQAARRRGAPVTLIEPAPRESARLADRVIRVAPGGDGLLALAALRWLHERGALDPEGLERCENWPAMERLLAAADGAQCAERAGVPAADVEHLAALYRDHGPVGTWIGWGLQRCSAGGAAVRWIDALALLTGNLGYLGGGASFTSWRIRGLDRSALAPATGRTIPAWGLGSALDALSDPPARFVYVAAANPVTQHPGSQLTDAALRSRERFVVVADAFMTDTARAADLVLPVQLMLEEPDVVGSYQHHHVAVAQRVVDPPEGVRPDPWIVRELNARLGRLPDPLLEDPEAAVAQIAAPWLEGAKTGWRRNPRQPEVQFGVRFATPSGKARLVSERPPEPLAVDGFPLALLTLAASEHQASWREAGEPTEPLDCWVHPAAAEAAGLGDGDACSLVGSAGRLCAVLRCDAQLHERVCLVRRGGSLAAGRCVNVLVPEGATDLGDGAAFYDARVRLEARG